MFNFLQWHAAAASPAGSPDSAPDSPNTNSGTVRSQKLVSDRLTDARL